MCAYWCSGLIRIIVVVVVVAPPPPAAGRTPCYYKASSSCDDSDLCLQLKPEQCKHHQIMLICLN